MYYVNGAWAMYCGYTKHSLSTAWPVYCLVCTMYCGNHLHKLCTLQWTVHALCTVWTEYSVHELCIVLTVYAKHELCTLYSVNCVHEQCIKWPVFINYVLFRPEEARCIDLCLDMMDAISIIFLITGKVESSLVLCKVNIFTINELISRTGIQSLKIN